MRARFVGDPRNGGDGPETITVLGLSFVKGEWREVGDDARFATHDHFETAPSAKRPQLDHDKDGREGGSRRRVKRGDVS